MREEANLLDDTCGIGRRDSGSAKQGALSMHDDTPDGLEVFSTENPESEDWFLEDVAETEFPINEVRRSWRGMLLAFALGVGVCAVVWAVFWHGEASTLQPVSLSAADANAQNGSGTGANSVGKVTQIEVDIHGDVLHPGVYTLPFNARVEDAVKAAGGYVHTSDADNVNAAAQLTDGSEVDIPGPPMATGSSSSPTTARDSSGGSNNALSDPAQTNRIDLNTADLATLETLPDIGPARAAAIISYRVRHGAFASVSDLTNVTGIGQGILSRISPYLYVPSTNR